MDSRVFEYAVAIEDAGSYTKAAKQLHMTPQGLVSAIRRLEGQMGLSLFKGNNEGVVPTSYGKVFCAFSRRYEAEYAAMKEEMAEILRKESHTIRVSVSTGLFNVLPRETFCEFNSNNDTGARVEVLRTVVDFDCENALLEKMCDFALLNDPIDHTVLASLPLHKDTMFLWGPKDSPLMQKEALTLSDIEGITIACLTPTEFKESRVFTEKATQLAKPCTCVFADEMIEILELSMRKGIYGLVPRTHAFAFSSEDYTAVPISDLTWGFSIAYLHERELTAQDEALLAFLRKRASFFC